MSSTATLTPLPSRPLPQAAGAPICAVLSFRVALTRPSSQILDSPSLSLGVPAADPFRASAEAPVAEAAGATDRHSFRVCFLAARTDVAWIAGRLRTRVAPLGVPWADGAVLEP